MLEGILKQGAATAIMLKKYNATPEQLREVARQNGEHGPAAICKCLTELMIKGFAEDLAIICDVFNIEHQTAEVGGSDGDYSFGACIEIKHR